ncbi:MAG TPA: alpha/beta hydrolase [Solirubrobacteraceae bacterium]|nr:alpha/beta hydrolase [Solirubrobacteraceae bacterium]
MSARQRQRAPQALEAAAIAVVASLPRPVKRMIAGAPIERDGLTLDLDMQLVVRFAERSPRAPLPTVTPVQARDELRRSTALVSGRPRDDVAVREAELAGGAGPLRARVYEPLEGRLPGAGVLYLHGGGWVVGDLDTHEVPCRALAASSGATVVSVDYRLGPEDPFPAPVDDAIAAFTDLCERADDLGLDAGRLAVAGDSAGGHLAAVTAQHAARAGGAAPAFQLLIYPATDLAEKSASRRIFAEGFLLTDENIDWYRANFLAAGGDVNDPRVSPLLAPDLAGLAPAMVVTAGFDPLRDEGESYARRLSDAGVRTVLRRHAGFVHGFINMAGVSQGAALALAEMGGVLRAALA